MIIFGEYDRDRLEESGQFLCPSCNHDCDFSFIRTWRYLHIFFVPLLKQELVSEKIICQQCENGFPITVLTVGAIELSTPLEASKTRVRSVLDNFGNIVQLTDAAVGEIKFRHAQGRFDGDVVVRVEPERSKPRAISVGFDFALADGRDWIGLSNGIPVIVDRADAAELHGVTVDFDGEEFVRL